jgi:hypothetical protein
MFRRGLFFRLIGLLVILALLAAGGSLIFRAGYSQGFLAGGLAAGAEGGAELFRGLPYGMAPHGWYGPGYGFSPLGPFLGLLFFGGLIFLFFGLFRRPFRRYHSSFGHWQTEGGPHWNPEAWEEHMKAWQKTHGPAAEETHSEPGKESGPDPKE